MCTDGAVQRKKQKRDPFSNSPKDENSAKGNKRGEVGGIKRMGVSSDSCSVLPKTLKTCAILAWYLKDDDGNNCSERNEKVYLHLQAVLQSFSQQVIHRNVWIWVQMSIQSWFSLLELGLIILIPLPSLTHQAIWSSAILQKSLIGC